MYGDAMILFAFCNFIRVILSQRIDSQMLHHCLRQVSSAEFKIAGSEVAQLCHTTEKCLSCVRRLPSYTPLPQYLNIFTAFCHQPGTGGLARCAYIMSIFMTNNCLQCTDTVGWASGRASSCKTMSDGLLACLSVWSEAQMICIWSS